MSRNLVEMVRRHHGEGAPTALDVLKDAMDRRGEITDDDRRVAAERSGLPEASVYGISTFYEDLLQPRGERHLRVCTGTACFAATADAHVDQVSDALGLKLGDRSDDRSVSLAETVCLGYCHASPAVRDGDVIDAGPGAVERLLAGETRPAPEPRIASYLDEPVLTKPGDWSGLRAALDASPTDLLEAVKAANVRGRGGAGFPAGTKWEFAAKSPNPERLIVANGDEGDPGSYIDKLLMEDNPALVLEGMALAGYAVGAGHGFILTRSEYPRSKPTLDAAIVRAREEGFLGTDILGSGFDFDITVVEGAGSYVVGEETALLSCLMGLRGTVSARPPFPAERGAYGLPTVVNNIETLANIPFIARSGAEAYHALSPDGATPGSKLVCFNERFERPGMYEVPFGLTMRQLCEEVAGGMAGGRSLKALQIGGPLGGILPAERIDTAFDFDALAAEGCMVGHGGIVGFDDTTDMRALAEHLLRFGADESCGKCFPCRIGLRRAHTMFASDAPVSLATLEPLLEALELGSLCAHGGGIAAPIRSLLTHFPDELRLLDDAPVDPAADSDSPSLGSLDEPPDGEAA